MLFCKLWTWTWPIFGLSTNGQKKLQPICLRSSSNIFQTFRDSDLYRIQHWNNTFGGGLSDSNGNVAWPNEAYLACPAYGIHSSQYLFVFPRPGRKAGRAIINYAIINYHAIFSVQGLMLMETLQYFLERPSSKYVCHSFPFQEDPQLSWKDQQQFLKRPIV